MSAAAKLTEELLLEQFKSVIIVSQGDAVTKGKPDKDKESLIYSNILSTLANGVERFNFVYKDELVKRSHQASTFAPFFVVVDSLTVQQWETLKESFPVEPTSAKKKETWDHFKDIQSLCRNNWSVIYNRGIKNLPSGSYDDSDILLAIREKEIANRIEQNYRKAVSTAVATFKKTTSIETLEVLAFTKTKTEEFQAIYALKTQAWKQTKLFPGFLAFILLGSGGLKLPSLTVENGTGTTKSMLGRRGMSESSKELNLSTSKNSKKDDDVARNQNQEHALYLKEQELKLKASVISSKLRKDRIAELKELKSMLEENGEKGSDDYESARLELMEILKESLNRGNKTTIEFNPFKIPIINFDTPDTRGENKSNSDPDSNHDLDPLS
jgi:hypothetical protein